MTLAGKMGHAARTETGRADSWRAGGGVREASEAVCPVDSPLCPVGEVCVEVEGPVSEEEAVEAEWLAPVHV